MKHFAIDGNKAKCFNENQAKCYRWRKLMSRKDPQFNLRLPEEVKEWVEQSAKENCRSKTAEIVYWLMAAKRRKEQAVA
ncbi:Arc family DNA-binding protein [Pseudomonas atacamensis]|uniref:Arc family DNA-binding protein n=1 Tax=Pseudomonas atacamensis TaxID=2565368 RepID=UPI003AF144A5